MSKQVCLVFSYKLEWLLILFTVLVVQPAKAQDIPKSDNWLSVSVAHRRYRLAKTPPQAKPLEATKKIRQLSELKSVVTSAKMLNPINVERVEVLKGPASVLYGQFESGRIVNYLTKQPLSTPSYTGELTVGNYDFYHPSLDISQPLTSDKKLLSC